MTENQLYAKAAIIAASAMGPGVGRKPRNRPRELAANQDPLAHWLLTENIVDLAKNFRDANPEVKP